jgi:hypothetical protein
MKKILLRGYMYIYRACFRMFTHRYAHAGALYQFAMNGVRLGAYPSLKVSLYMCVCLWIYIHIYICIYVCMYMCIYIYIMRL